MTYFLKRYLPCEIYIKIIFFLLYLYVQPFFKHFLNPIKKNHTINQFNQLSSYFTIISLLIPIDFINCIGIVEQPFFSSIAFLKKFLSDSNIICIFPSSVLSILSSFKVFFPPFLRFLLSLTFADKIKDNTYYYTTCVIYLLFSFTNGYFSYVNDIYLLLFTTFS